MEGASDGRLVPILCKLMDGLMDFAGSLLHIISFPSTTFGKKSELSSWMFMALPALI